MEFFNVSWKSCNRKESIKARPDIVFPGLTKKIRLMARCPRIAKIASPPSFRAAAVRLRRLVAEGFTLKDRCDDL